jgi:hypothetical protein
MKTITRTWLSIGLALLFGILAAGSIFDSTTTTYDEKTGEYTERTEDNDSGRVSYTTGKQNKDGTWEGVVIETPDAGSFDYKSYFKSEYHKGIYNGWSCHYNKMYSEKDYKLYSRSFYKNGVKVANPQGEPGGTLCPGPLGSSNAFSTLEELAASGDIASTFAALEAERPWFIHVMEAWGYGNEPMQAFLLALEDDLKSKSADLTRVTFDSLFNTSYKTVGELEAHKDLYDAASWTRDLGILEAQKLMPLRLALLDRIRAGTGSTYSTLLDKYPDYPLTLQSYGASLTDMEAVANELDKRFDAEPPLDINDPLFPSQVTKRMSQVFQAMLGNFKFGTMQAALEFEDEQISWSNDPIRIAAKHFLFEPDETRILSLHTDPGGKVAIAPMGADCTGTCFQYFADGVQAVLTATPDKDHEFKGWEGGCNGTEPTCDLDMSADRPVLAHFADKNAVYFDLAVFTSGNGNGKVTSSPPGIDCGATCSGSFIEGTAVALSAVPDAGSEFEGWSGACSGKSACVVNITAAQNVTATFTRAYALTVTKTGPGTVTSSPAGIDCGATCMATFSTGASVTLTATPGPGAEFQGWGGACSGKQPTCVVSMNSAQAVTASFKPVYQLVVDKTGQGTVTSVPEGIQCGGTCAAGFVEGVTVTLTATPDAGYRFVQWSGACSGTAACTVTMDAAKSVTATFEQIQYSLSVTKTGSGSIVSSPPGIDCGTVCSALFKQDTSVTLSATPAVGFTFNGWGGACIGQAACVVVLNDNRTVSANFAEIPTVPYKTVKGFTQLTLSAGAINALATQGVILKPLSPAKLVGQTAKFTLNGGIAELPVGARLKASFNHIGGLSFKKKATTVNISKFIIDANSGLLTGNVSIMGKPLGRMPLFNMDLSKASVESPTGKLVVTNVGLSLTQTVADALNAAFKVGVAPGLPIGTARIQVDKTKLIKQ